MENLNTTSANTLLEENPTKPLDLDLDAIIPSPVDPNQGDATVDANNKDPSDEDSKSSKVTTASENTTATTTPVTDTEKKIRRAERFGITVQLSEQEKRNSRAERFGTATGTGTVTGTGSTTKGAEELKRKARAERFGLPVTVNADEEAKKKARLQRFAPTSKTEEDAKKERPSQPSSNSLSMNGKGNVEPKAAIAGKAGGGS